MKLFWEILEFIFSNKNDTLLIDHTNPLNPLYIPPYIKTQRERIYDFSKSCLGKDIAFTQNELGCAEAVSYILNKIEVPSFPNAGFLSTISLHQWLEKHATPLKDPLPGDIIISPSTATVHGHVGIVAYHGILSNNSMNGLFQEVYTLGSWEHYYADKLGLKVLFYRPFQ